MKWQEAALTILDREVRQDRMTDFQRDGFRNVLGDGDAGKAFFTIGNQLAPRCRHWNKFRAGSVLFGWWGNIVTSEPIRLAAIDAMQNESIGDEIKRYLTASWNGTPTTALSLEASNLGSQLGLDLDGGSLTPSELRFLQRINLDCRDRAIIEKWRWSNLVGVAYLSDDGRETIKPEAACGRSIEVIATEDLTLPVNWKNLFLSLSEKDEIIQTDGLPNRHEFVKSMEFWGLGRSWEGGIKVFAPVQKWLKRFALDLNPLND